MNIFQRTKQFNIVIGIGLMLLSLFFLFAGDSSLQNPERVLFESESGDLLLGYFHQSENPRDFGVLLLEGFGSDQISMRSVANEFLIGDVQVFTFDFMGHGRSEGTLKLDNSSTDIQSKQVLSALSAFQELSGLDLSHIFLMGHSLGARVAVQAVVENDLEVAGLILLGPQINLTSNAQSEFFTGTSDVEISWVAGLDESHPDVPMLILSGTWEDILPVESAKPLMEKLTGKANISSATVYGGNGFPTREWQLLPGVFHNFEIYSPKALNISVDWVGDQMELELNHAGRLNPSARKIVFWVSGMIGVLQFLFGVKQYAENRALPMPLSELTVHKRNVYLKARVWLWIPAILLGVVILSPFLFLPLGLPLFNIYYVVFISGYGALSMGLFIIGKMPGLIGKLEIKKEIQLSKGIDWRRVLVLNAGIFVFMALFARSGWFWVPPTGDRFIWLLIFTPLTALGFWSGAIDLALLSAQDEQRKLWVQANGFLPFILYAGLMVSISSWSGMINGVIGLFMLWIVFQQGKITTNLTGSRWLAAVLQAILLYMLILPQGVLFTF